MCLNRVCAAHVINMRQNIYVFLQLDFELLVCGCVCAPQTPIMIQLKEPLAEPKDGKQMDTRMHGPRFGNVKVH